MCAKRRQFEREHAEDLRISAIFIKYTVGSFNRESVQSINRDDVAICREIGGRDWIVTVDYHKSLSVRAILLQYKLYKEVLPLISPVKLASEFCRF